MQSSFYPFSDENFMASAATKHIFSSFTLRLLLSLLVPLLLWVLTDFVYISFYYTKLQYTTYCGSSSSWMAGKTTAADIVLSKLLLTLLVVESVSIMFVQQLLTVVDNDGRCWYRLLSSAFTDYITNELIRSQTIARQEVFTFYIIHVFASHNKKCFLLVRSLSVPRYIYSAI